MSKSKLALLVFALAFGVNIVAFVFSKKAYVIEELKNVWLYELPLTASPLDAYVGVDFTPQHGVIGTLAHVSDQYEFKAGKGKEPSVLRINLKEGLSFSNGDPITTKDWMDTRAWALTYVRHWSADPMWDAYAKADMSFPSVNQAQFTWAQLPKDFNADAFMKTTLSHPMTGVIHPANLAAMALPKAQQEKKITKHWISSGPYKVMKWNPKEITLVSRDNFPATIQKEFFRTLKFQSAPVKNPSCHFMHSMPGEEKGMDDHKVVNVDQTLHVFWVCRSWKQAGSFCSIEQNRSHFAQLIAGNEQDAELTLSGQKVRYRIPFGSDAFRNEITEKIKAQVSKHGGIVEEVSYFFKPSTEADIELLMVVADAGVSTETAAKMAVFSSRLEMNESSIPANLVGEFFKTPIQVLMKNMKGDPFSKVFLEPDLEEKKMPL